MNSPRDLLRFNRQGFLNATSLPARTFTRATALNFWENLDHFFACASAQGVLLLLLCIKTLLKTINIEPLFSPFLRQSSSSSSFMPSTIFALPLLAASALAASSLSCLCWCEGN